MDHDGDRMAMLEDTNPLRGLSDDGSGIEERVRSARRMAVLALGMAVLWGFGFLSAAAVAVGSGAFLLLNSRDRAARYRWVALAGILLGATGFVLTAAYVV